MCQSNNLDVAKFGSGLQGNGTSPSLEMEKQSVDPLEELGYKMEMCRVRYNAMKAIHLFLAGNPHYELAVVKYIVSRF